MCYSKCLCKAVSACYLSSFGISYGYELLSNDRQHFDVDSVKFVKTTPSTRLSKATKETPHHLEERRME